MYPKILPFHARHDKASFTVATLDELARFPAVILDWNDEARAGWAPDGLTPGQYIRQANPTGLQLAYIPAAYWWSQPTMSVQAAPHRVAVQMHLNARNLWLRGPNDQPIEPWPGQPLLSPDAVAYLSDYVAEHFDRSHWDGIHFDVLTSEIIHLGASAQQSAAVVNDLQQMAANLFHAGIYIQGNGSWAPDPEDISLPSPYYRFLDGAMVEKFPSYPWYSLNGQQQPLYDYRFAFHMRQAQTWIDAGKTCYAFHDDSLHSHEWFGRFIPTVWQGRRFVLASACLAGAWYVPPMRQTLPWTDEIAVVDGATTKDPAGIGWLGDPVEAPQSIGFHMRREFQNGQVLVNASQLPYTFGIGQGWRRIAGWYDKQTNNGQRVDGQITLAPFDAILLIRAGAPLPTPTPQPEPPTTPAPDPRFQRLEQLHAASLLLEQSLANQQRAIAAYDHARRVWQDALDALEN